MIRTTCFAVVAALFAVSSCSALASTIQIVPGIPSFDTNLGTLLSATVTIDPPLTLTEEYEPGPFENVGNHRHFVSPLPVNVPGLGSFPFGTTPTNFVNPSTGQDHGHVFNLAPSVQTFTGPGLAWFLNPQNGLFSVNVLTPPTTFSDDHNHLVPAINVVPSTRFLYAPTTVPEPGGLALLASLLTLAARRRR
ncbi:MAG: hypothetical protein AAGF31_10680 [Planctomycetota bacterium]